MKPDDIKCLLIDQKMYLEKDVKKILSDFCMTL